MGIYPSTKYERQRGNTVLLVTTDTGYGLEITEVYQLVAQFDKRKFCYCCSCGDRRDGSDIACRNHGWAASRPCELHDMPGQSWGEEMCDNLYAHKTLKDEDHIKSCWMDQMPKSVQAIQLVKNEEGKNERSG